LRCLAPAIGRFFVQRRCDLLFQRAVHHFSRLFVSRSWIESENA
jgi:hypothetical protein